MPDEPIDEVYEFVGGRLVQVNPETGEPLPNGRSFSPSQGASPQRLPMIRGPQRPPEVEEFEPGPAGRTPRTEPEGPDVAGALESGGRIAAQGGLGFLVGGLPGAALGAGGEVASQALGGPTGGAEGLPTAAAMTGGDFLANLVLNAVSSKVPGAKQGFQLLQRTGRLAQKKSAIGQGLLRGGVHGSVAAASFKAGQDLESKLGIQQELPTGGDSWLIPAAVGMLTGITTGGIETITQYYKNQQGSDIFRAATSFRKSPETAGINVGAGVAEEMNLQKTRSFFTGKGQIAKASLGAREVRERLFPTQLQGTDVIAVHNNLTRALTKKGAGSFREELRKGLTKKEFTLLQQFVSSSPKKATKMLKDVFESDDSLRMLKVLKRASKVTGDEDFVEDMTNEWVRQQIFKPASMITTRGSGAPLLPGTGRQEIEAAIDGKAMLERLQQLQPDLVDEVLGPGRHKALQNLAQLMDFMEAADVVQGKQNGLQGTIRYLTNHALFGVATGMVVGGAGAEMGMMTVSGAGLIGAGAFGLAAVVRKAISSPTIVKIMEKAAKDPTGEYARVFVRAMTSSTLGTEGEPEATIPSSRIRN